MAYHMTQYEYDALLSTVDVPREDRQLGVRYRHDGNIPLVYVRKPGMHIGDYRFTLEKVTIVPAG